MTSSGKRDTGYAHQASDQRKLKREAESLMAAAESVSAMWPEYGEILRRELISVLRRWNKGMASVQVPVSYSGLNAAVSKTQIVGALLLQYPRAWAIRAETTILWWRINWKNVLWYTVIAVAIVLGIALAVGAALWVYSVRATIIDVISDVVARLLDIFSNDKASADNSPVDE